MEFHWFSYHFQILIYLIHLSFSNLYLYAIRSITLFLKVLNKVNFKVLAQTKLFLIIDLFPCIKLLELLAVNHSSSERSIIFVPRLLKFSHVLVVL